jgi:hypothetical protein
VSRSAARVRARWGRSSVIQFVWRAVSSYFLKEIGSGRTAFCANPARRRNAFATSTEVISPSESCAARSSTVLSVILISSGERTSFARGIVFTGTSLTSGRAGLRAAMLSSLYFCLSAATSCHVAPEAMVNFAAIVSSCSQFAMGERGR